MRHVSIADLAANATELTAAADAGDEVVVTYEGREYRLIAADSKLPPDRQRVMDETTAFRERLRARGVRVTREEVRAWIDEGRP